MVTMSDIAARAGVSRPTVSVVLNQRDAIGICAETRQRVLDAADALGYRRNELARAVGSGKNRMIGFIAVAPQVEFVAQMMVGALDETEKRGYTLKILRVRTDIVDKEVIDLCVGLRLAGVVAVHINHEPSLDYLHQELDRHGIPLALVDSSFPHRWGIRVISHDEEGIRAATNHLVGLGHRRIGFVGGAADSGSAALREQGFRQSMKDSGLRLREEMVVQGEWDAAVTEVVTRGLLTRPAGERPSAIVCASDAMAMVVVRTARRFGLDVPEELSVVGYGNLARTELCDPPLTTVEQPFHMMGLMAVRSLLARREAALPEDINAPLEHVLETRLVLRESTAAPFDSN